MLQSAIDAEVAEFVEKRAGRCDESGLPVGRPGLRHLTHFASTASKLIRILEGETRVCELARTQATSEAIALILSREKLGWRVCGSIVVFCDQPNKVQAFGGARYFSLVGISMHIGRISGRRRPVDATRVEPSMDYVFGASYSPLGTLSNPRASWKKIIFFTTKSSIGC